MFLLAFWTWHCTTFNSIPIILNLLTNRDIALIYSVIICEQKTKDCARSGSFQQKLQHHCFQLWCLPGFLTSLLYWLWLKVQRTGHYLSPGGGLGGITWFLGKQKGGSIVTENPKGGIIENFGGIQRGDHSNSLGKWRHGGGGSRKSSNVIRVDHFSEVTFKGESAKFHLV